MTPERNMVDELIVEHAAMLEFFASLEPDDLQGLNGVLSKEKFALLLKALEVVADDLQGLNGVLSKEKFALLLKALEVVVP